MEAQPLIRPGRRRLLIRVSVRAVMAFVLVIGVGLGWIVRVIRRAEAQRAAVQAIEEAGGGVWYDWEWRGGNSIPNAKPPWHEWITKRGGVASLSKVVSLDLFERGSDAMLVHVGHLSGLEELNLNQAPVT